MTAARPYTIRPATPGDQAAIAALVWAEGLNTESLRWPDFLVAVDEARHLIGTVQLRRHADGARELASLVVVPEWRGRGLATLYSHSRFSSFQSPPSRCQRSRTA